VHPVGKTCVGSKNDCNLFDGLDVLYHYAKFGEDRTIRAGCRCENVVFVCFFLFFWRTFRSRVTYFEQVLCRDLWVNFFYCLHRFSALISLSEALHNSFLLGGTTIFV